MIVAGTPVTCTIANTAYQLTATNISVKTMFVQPRYDNAGVLFIGNSTLAPATNVGVYGQLQVPSPTNIPTYRPSETESQNGLQASTFWVASTQAGDIVLWSYDQQ